MTEKTIKSTAQGMTRHMPFPCHQGAVSIGFHNCRQKAFCPFCHESHFGSVAMSAHQCGPGWFTFGCIMEIGKANTPGSQLIKVWSYHFASKTPEVGITKVVSYNKYNVGISTSRFFFRIVCSGVSVS